MSNIGPTKVCVRAGGNTEKEESPI